MQRFDSFGLAFEGYGPVGDARTKDLAGRPVDTSVTFPGGVDGTGVAGLQSFIRDHRQDKFVDNLSRKLLAYALNRSLQLSDEALVDKMKTSLAANGYRFRALVETIVLSPQFLNRRIAEARRHASAEPQPARQAAQSQFPEGELTMTQFAYRPAPSPAAPCCAAPAAPWRCPGWNRSTPWPMRPRPPTSPSASAWCSWAAASTRIIGAPKARAPT